ncbi:MAG TPA: hypothetical protein VE982_05070 [Gaiellaceae bacterium]|nr:hypothetical protein [Gaiellaceae bacterium]
MKALAALAVASFLLGVPAWAAAAPRLSLERTAPLTIRGRAFPPHEHLVLKMRSGLLVRTRRVTTTAAGRFVLIVRGAPVARCASLVIRAFQPSGAVTTLKRPPLPACLPASTS